MSTALSELRPLLERLRGAVHDPSAAATLDRLAARLDEPLIVALAGKVKAGKSTLMNALIGEPLAPTDAGECTQLVTWYRNGPTYRVRLDLKDGTSRQAPFQRPDGALEVDLGGTPVEAIERMVIDWPSSRLAQVTLIDTPGLDSITTTNSARTHAFLGTEGDGEGEADAVIYLMRHVHRTDLTFLEAFRDDTQAGASPISALAVLSRADEVGACRLDAMSSARRIATGWRDDPRLRRLCQTVVPVAGLVAEAATLLREDQYRVIATLAALPRADMDRLLLTADRFLNDRDCPVTQVEREELLERLGVFGVRLSISLVRLGAAPTASALATELTNRSGVNDLRNLLTTVLAERRSVLKARVALAGLDAVLSGLPDPVYDPFRLELERISASAHEFTEVHLLNAIRAGSLALKPAEVDELERLLGSIGAPSHERLGLGPDADVREAVLDGVERWRRRAENPLSPLAVSEAARAVARTYEGLLASSR
ncbi:MAG: dynamin family protein [Ilumatobacteraceae bacterium]|nr:dynamin family protein [Acidimicrobiales bacterium]MCB9393263.1 dynamin family protein [Acidimicrobiaceae bacterium]